MIEQSLFKIFQGLKEDFCFSPLGRSPKCEKRREGRNKNASCKILTIV